MSRELDCIAYLQTRRSKKQARKQADDVASLAARKHQIVYACLRSKLAILDTQHQITFHRDELVPCLPFSILTQ